MNILTNEILLPVVSCQSQKAIDTVRASLKIPVYRCFLHLSPLILATFAAVFWDVTQRSPEGNVPHLNPTINLYGILLL